MKKQSIEKQGVCILGSTGSVGQNSLAVIRQHPDLFKIVALSAQVSVDRLFEQCCEFEPTYAVIESQYLPYLRDKVSGAGLATTVLAAKDGLCMIASLPQVSKVIAAIVGAAGLLPVMSAIEAGKQILLANKETLVMAGDRMLEQAKKSHAILLPVDSEHNALFQCMPPGYMTGFRPEGVKQLILTASGGPFLNASEAELTKVTPEMAIIHPNWKMGKKITVDCATLMNKGLEVIEACKLFQFSAHEVEVLVHPQSIIHSLVEYIDGSLLAQMGEPDMKIPLAYCLSWPKRFASGAKRLSLSQIGQLTFFEPNNQKFKCLPLAFEALQLGKAAPAVLNASNEVAVNAFLNRQTSFAAIPAIIEKVLQRFYDLSDASLPDILRADKIAREETMRLINTSFHYV